MLCNFQSFYFIELESLILVSNSVIPFKNTLFAVKKKLNCPNFNKTLKGIRGERLDNQKIFCAPGPWTKYFERIFGLSMNYIFN